MKTEKITVFPKKENDREPREPYTSPEICVYGALEKLTQMPGGSIQLEGASGKGHKKERPHPGPKHKH